MNYQSKIYVAGHRGLVGSALARVLERRGYNNVVFRSRDELDLRDRRSVERFFQEEKPEYVFLAAAKVGGIGFNASNPADFARDNLLIQTNVIHAASLYNCDKLLFIGSACIYPVDAQVPIKESDLLGGPLEQTNICYALAKIMGYHQCLAYGVQYGLNTISAMPNNVYGINDNFNLNECHVIPALIKKFIDARDKSLKKVICFGDGTPTREFLFADDLAEALVFLMINYENPEIINVGPGFELSIGDLAQLISRLVGFEGEIAWDKSKPNGTPRRALDISKMNALGWTAPTTIQDGLKQTIAWYENNEFNCRR